MSDQDTKPVEGVKTPVENTEVVAPESNIDDADTVAVEDEDESKTNVDVAKDTEEPSAAEQDATNTTDGDQGNAEQDAKTEADEKDAKAETAEQDVKAEVDESESTAATPTDGTPGVKPMLRVKRGETQEKSDPSLLSDSDDHTLIRRQIHFYFSDSNLPNDTFLWGKTGGTENKPVPLSLISSFSRMRRFKPYSAVVDALKTSDQVVLEGPEGEETVRRKEPYQQSDEKDRAIVERTVYIKGFGPEHKSLQFDIEDFVAQFGEFNAVRLRRDEQDSKKNFKGSVFVEWADKETAVKFMALEPKPAWKVGENLHKLDFQWRIDYDKAKAAEEAAGGNKRHFNSRPQRGQHGQRGQRGGRGRGGHDSNDWKKRRDDDQRNGGNNRGDRGGRGRGRGNRGRGRGRAQDNNGRNADQVQATPRDNGRPRINLSKESAIYEAEKKSKKDTEANTNGKRTRDATDAADAPPAKKVDTK
ncbi:hypothetical protein GGR53DRAFT_91214 [Hypoxylon sp. FL1150]|nr:hypothetical protein GGR53DRAFT_91214 [Hypoxylon sp. FL1150]